MARRWITKRFQVSERRACRLLVLARSTSRYGSISRPSDGAEAALLALAAKHPGVGYRQLYKRLRRAGWKINHKRVHRIYREMKLQQRRRKRRVRIEGSGPVVRAMRTNEIWAMDFMADRLTRGQAYRLLTMLDCFNRECLRIDVNSSMSSVRVARIVSEIAAKRGLPEMLLVDNGPEFRGKALKDWAERNGVKIHYIDPGRPTQNGTIESFNSIVRSECLELRSVDSIGEARKIVEDWREDYNNDRPHGSLGDATPVEFAAAAPPPVFRPLIDGRVFRSDNLRLMEKRKTIPFPAFPQAPPLTNSALITGTGNGG